MMPNKAYILNVLWRCERLAMALQLHLCSRCLRLESQLLAVKGRVEVESTGNSGSQYGYPAP